MTPDSFFFCDPPYLDTDQNFSDTSQCNFDIDDYRRLKIALDNLEGKFLLTTNSHPAIKELFKDYYIENVKVGYSVSKETSGRRDYGELIITNYKTEYNKSVA